ncbi:hypothetical protein QTP88_010927 [Uroleucon formosanum]
MSNKKYSDHLHKELMWIEIASTLDQPGIFAKKRGVELRRSSKKLITVSGQKSKFIKKWKFSDEMEFLKKHMKKRESIRKYMSENSDGSIEIGQEVIEPLSNKIVKTSAPSTKQLFPKKKYEKNETNTDSTVPQNASATLMKFILDSRDNKSSESDKKLDALDKFFTSICSTVKEFFPYLQHVAKNNIFLIVSKLELEQLKYTQPQTSI